MTRPHAGRDRRAPRVPSVMPAVFSALSSTRFHYMSNDTPIQYGEVTATYFWDDGSGINGDTGMPASGEPMQKGLFSSPSWPLGTEGYVVHEGRKAEFFIGDRGPGAPSQDCDVLLDIDGKTFAELTGQTWNEDSYTVSGGNGHLEVEYYITEWGDGNGTEGAPHPFQEPGNTCEDAVSPIPQEALPREAPEEATEEGTAAGSPAPENGERADQRQQPEKSAPAPEEEGVTAGTAANDLSGFRLMDSEGVLGGTGLLALALVLLAVLHLSWVRRPSGAHAGAVSGGRGLLASSGGRHARGSRLGAVLARVHGR